MKIIHCADLHIGSKMDSKYPAQKAQTRRQELRNAFVNLAEKAEEIGASAILISGDAFDSDHPGEKDLEYFYGVIAAHPGINFYYLRGNHDIDGYGPNDPLSNLFTFSSNQWSTYAFDEGKVTVSGIEITKDNKDVYYDTEGLATNPDCFNIAMLHGQVGSDINLTKLAHRNFHYIALGHVHSFKMYEMPDKCIAIYSGILEPRGFDETGEKGFVIIDTEARQYFFQPFNKRTVHWERLDISNIKSEFDISNAVKALLEHSNDIYRVELVGEKDDELRINVSNLISRCKASCFLLDVIDETKKPDTVPEIKLDTPLIREFVSKMEMESGLTGDERAEAVEIGLKALAGKEF